MIPATIRLFRPQGPDRIAVVSVETSARGDHLIRLGRGPRSDRLTSGNTYGPYAEADLALPHAELLANLKQEGFLRGGLHALFAALQDTNAAVRARAALRLGRRGDPEAVEPLLAARSRAVDDACPIMDALGWIGDVRAIPILREYAARKLLSRRRSAVEALRNIEDEEGLAEAVARGRERLPAPVRDALDADDEQAVLRAVRALDPPQLGLTLDTLYELATPRAVGVVRTLLAELRYDRPHVWRYIKSIFKRAILRFDHRTFGEVTHAIEIQARTSTGTTATVKSGYDGVDRSTSIFRQKTQLYLRRLAWRHLRQLAFHRPAVYPYAAAEAIVPYEPKDAEKPHDLFGPFAGCHLLNRVIHGRSRRFVVDDFRLTFRFADNRAVRPSAGVREEFYPELWDAEPRAYLRVLGAARLPEAHVFAVRALSTQRMKEAVLMTADHEEILALLHAPYDPTVELGLEELDRRFDPQRPDWALIALVLGDVRPIVAERARRWIRVTASLWTKDVERIVAFLERAHPGLRGLVVELASDHLRSLSDVRRRLAMLLVRVLSRPESSPGAHEALGTLCRLVLLEELEQLLTLDDVLGLIVAGSPSAQAVGGDLLARRTDSIAQLGLERLVSLAQHEIVAVRNAAHKLLRASIALLKIDPTALFVLVESGWQDTRTLAFELLRSEIRLETLGLDGLIGLIDSGRADVREMGRELVRRHFASLPADQVIGRLVEHPSPGMRPFTIDLVLQYLPHGVGPLQSVQNFCRAALFDVWPDRRVKRRVIELLRDRGVRDAEEAKTAAGLLREAVKTKGRADFERALEALVRLKLAFPDLDCGVRLLEGGPA